MPIILLDVLPIFLFNQETLGINAFNTTSKSIRRVNHSIQITLQNRSLNKEKLN